MKAQRSELSIYTPRDTGRRGPAVGDGKPELDEASFPPERPKKCTEERLRKPVSAASPVPRFSLKGVFRALPSFAASHD